MSYCQLPREIRCKIIGYWLWAENDLRRIARSSLLPSTQDLKDKERIYEKKPQSSRAFRAYRKSVREHNYLLRVLNPQRVIVGTQVLLKIKRE